LRRRNDSEGIEVGKAASKWKRRESGDWLDRKRVSGLRVVKNFTKKKKERRQRVSLKKSKKIFSPLDDEVKLSGGGRNKAFNRKPAKVGEGHSEGREAGLFIQTRILRAR